jgi:hypothetical protein
VLNEKWQEKGIFFINDIKTNGNGLMSVEELDLKYLITNVCMFYNSLLSCLPRFWKRLIQNSARYFFKKYVIKSFTCLNTISNFIKLFHVGPGHRQKPCTILNEALPKSRETT